MFDKSLLVSKLGDYSKDPTKKSEIISQMMFNPDVESRIQIIPGVTDEIPMPNALIGDPLAPLADADAVTYKTNVIQLDAEVLKTKQCILAVKITPTKIWNTYLSTMEAVNLRRKIASKNGGVPFSPFVMPFHEFFLEKLVEAAQSSIYGKAIFKGVRDEGGTNSSGLFDGFEKLVDDATTATKNVETITGTIDASNVMQKMYLLNDALGEESKNNALNAHLAGNVFDALVRTMNPLVNTSLVGTVDLLTGQKNRVNEIYIPGTNITAYREPGMTANRCIVTEQNNLAIGYSVNPKDIEFEIQHFDLSLKVLFYFKAGTAIGKLKSGFGALSYNEKASAPSE